MPVIIWVVQIKPDGLWGKKSEEMRLGVGMGLGVVTGRIGG